jgi:hypothetical protein
MALVLLKLLKHFEGTKQEASYEAKHYEIPFNGEYNKHRIKQNSKLPSFRGFLSFNVKDFPVP